MSVLALDYKILPVENCTSSDQKVVQINECSSTAKVFNIAGEAFVSLEKAFVSIFSDCANVQLLVEHCRQFFFFSPQVNMELLVWKFTTFVRIFKVERFELCALLAGSPKSNRFLKAFVNAVLDASPNLLIKCPYFGRKDFYNITVSKTFLNLIPVGRYKVKVNVEVVERAKVTLFFVVGFELMQ